MKEPHLYLTHMIDCLEKIQHYTNEGEEIFLSDPKTQDAVYRNLEILGEAAKRVPEEIRTMEPLIQWRRISGLRDVLIHQYDGVNPLEVWKIIKSDLPNLRTQLHGLLNKLDVG
ncbi:MAG: DUF86 domain-containing protein [Magnetococcales bacterium]|nr:DUF86 domain-containing protein [Magnetococcales bacterium]